MKRRRCARLKKAQTADETNELGKSADKDESVRRTDRQFSMAAFTAETISPTWTAQTPDALGKRPRVDSVDVLRGVIMIIMAIDHVRDYFSNPGYDPTDLSQTSVALFFTRWITHFCAPVFFLLTGTGAYLSLRKQSRSAVVAIFVYARVVVDCAGIYGDARFWVAI